MLKIKNQFLNIYICIKISSLEKTSQRNYNLWNWGDYAKNDCSIAQLFIY